MDNNLRPFGAFLSFSQILKVLFNLPNRCLPFLMFVQLLKRRRAVVPTETLPESKNEGVGIRQKEIQGMIQRGNCQCSLPHKKASMEAHNILSYTST